MSLGELTDVIRRLESVNPRWFLPYSGGYGTPVDFQLSLIEFHHQETDGVLAASINVQEEHSRAYVKVQFYVGSTIPQTRRDTHPAAQAKRTVDIFDKEYRDGPEYRYLQKYVRETQVVVDFGRRRRMEQDENVQIKDRFFK